MTARKKADTSRRSERSLVRSLLANKEGWSREVSDPTTEYGIAEMLLGWMLYLLAVGDLARAPNYNLRDLIGRLAIAVAGGSSLLVPMILMTFLKGRTARLVIVCVATLLFAGFAAVTSAKKENIVASTAAYAAVTVVYIGSATPAEG